MALKSHFRPLEKPKIRIWRGRESDVSSGGQALGPHFFLLTSPKCDLVGVEKALFLGLARNFEILFGLWTSPKYDFAEVKKTTFPVVARHCELILYLLTSPKCDFDEVELVMFHSCRKAL